VSKGDHRSDAAAAYRRLYSLAAWRGKNGRRLQQLREEPLCRFCLIIGTVTEATVADHVQAHKGDADLFWAGPLQSLCAPCHNRLKAQVEAHGYHDQCDHTGWPVSDSHPANRKR
jgi:5-methylcytosine-specific restriction endonuclease McrA